MTYSLLENTWTISEDLQIQERFNIPKKIEVRGMGGVGQTYIAKMYNSKINESTKHKPYDGVKHPILYIYGHPSLAAQSHFRRSSLTEDNRWVKSHVSKIRNIKIDNDIIDNYRDYKKLVQKDEKNDIFQFLNNMESYSNSGNVLFITMNDYEDPDKRAIISKFTGSDVIPEIQERNSVIDNNVLPATWKKMQQIAQKKWEQHI